MEPACDSTLSRTPVPDPPKSQQPWHRAADVSCSSTISRSTLCTTTDLPPLIGSLPILVWHGSEYNGVKTGWDGHSGGGAALRRPLFAPQQLRFARQPAAFARIGRTHAAWSRRAEGGLGRSALVTG